MSQLQSILFKRKTLLELYICLLCLYIVHNVVRLEIFFYCAGHGHSHGGGSHGHSHGHAHDHSHSHGTNNHIHAQSHSHSHGGSGGSQLMHGECHLEISCGIRMLDDLYQILYNM